MKKLTNGKKRQAVMSNKKELVGTYQTKSAIKNNTGEVKNRYRYPEGTKVVKYITHEKQDKSHLIAKGIEAASS